MHARGVDIGAVEQVFIRRRVVGLDPIDQLVLAQVARRFGRRGCAEKRGFDRRRFGRLRERGDPDQVGGDRLGDERF
jgi:hypothetical protein